jgi:hypothetical protein
MKLISNTQEKHMTDSPFKNHPNFDPKVDAAVAAWVLATQRKDWVAMTEKEQGLAYMDFFVALDDDDLDEFMKQFPKPAA